MLSDEALMEAVARGDASALEALCRRWERSLHRVIWRQTGGRDVDDLHQETWLRVVRGAARFDPTRRFSTWLFRIAINLCRDWHRRRPADPVPPETVDREEAADTSAAAAAALDVSRLLAALPEAQREVVVLRYHHDLPEAEVAAILDVPVGTVKSRFHHAMATMRRMVAEEDA